MKLFRGRAGVDGFLTPDADGLRKYCDLGSGKMFDFQTEDTHVPNTVSIGRFIFRGEIFEKGNNKLSSEPCPETKVMVVDEIGRLEMEGKGFAPGFRTFIGKNSDKNIILIAVIRDHLVDAAVKIYGIEDALVVSLKEPDPEQVIRDFCGLEG